MRVIIVIIGLASILFNSCEKDKRNQEVSNAHIKVNTLVEYDKAFDVPVNNPGVVLNIDSLSFFESENLKNDNSTETKQLITTIKDLDKNFDAYNHIKKNTIRILKENNYKYTFIDNFNKKDFPNTPIDKENFNQLINFETLNKNYKQDEIVLINIKNGFDYNEEENSKYAAKTYVYIYIIDTKNHKLKFSESIAGTKYLDDPKREFNEEYLSEAVKESIENTIEIINNKY